MKRNPQNAQQQTGAPTPTERDNGEPTRKKAKLSEQEQFGDYFSQILGTDPQQAQSMTSGEDETLPPPVQIGTAGQQIDSDEIRTNAAWYRDTLLQYYEAQYLPDYVTNELPQDPQELYQTYDKIYQFYSWASQPQPQPPKSREPEDVINKDLNGLVFPQSQGSKTKIRAIDLTKSFERSQIDWQLSRKSVLQILEGDKIMGNTTSIWQRVSRWNTFAPDKQQISLQEAGLPDDFQPEIEDSDRPQNAPLTQTFTIYGQQHTLTERDGVKGGFHVIFDAPQEVIQRFGPALIRAPRNTEVSVAKGMKNYQVVQNMFTVPQIFNKAAEDGFYVVEKIGGDFDLSNEKHRKAVARAFRVMANSGKSFPFDLRVDNIKFREDELVVIDFSESGRLGGDVNFWKDSLIEFCWCKTVTKPYFGSSAGQNHSLLEQLLTDARKRGGLPKEMSPYTIDYDTLVLDGIWEELGKEHQKTIRSTLM
jgi:hypothetical protein